MLPRLEVKDLRLCYEGAEPLCEPISFQLMPGELALLTGASACGKSSLLSAINGVIPCHVKAQVQGEIFFDGRPMQGLDASQRSQWMGTVLQNPKRQILYDRVEDELAFPLENHAFPEAQMRKQVERQAKKLGLALDASPRHLSGGEQQQLMCELSLGLGQSLLLLDEPLANLDAKAARSLLQELKALCQKGHSVLMVEHRTDWLLPVADCFFLMDESGLRRFEKAQAFQAAQQPAARQRRKPNQAPGAPLFSIEELGFGFGDRILYEGLNWTVREGETWLLLGDNGVGKSSLLMLLAGLYKPWKGRLHFPKGRRKTRMAMVLQNPNLQLSMPSVAEECDPKHPESPAVRRLLKAFQLDASRQQHPQALSEGQKRKLGIAAALSQEPELLFLDEPSVGQDQDSLEALLAGLSGQHPALAWPKTQVILTHDLRLIQAMDAKVLYLKKQGPACVGTADCLHAFLEDMDLGLLPTEE